MLLIVEIAAGIVLAYLIIVNLNAIVALVGGLLALAGVVLVAALVVTGGIWGANYLAVNWAKILGGLAVLLCFIFGGVGGWFLIQLSRLLFGRPRVSAVPDDDSKQLFAFSLLNVALLACASYPVGAYTVAGSWDDAIYRWGFAHGLADGPQVLVFAIFLLWPVGPATFLAVLKARRPKAAPTGNIRRADADATDP